MPNRVFYACHGVSINGGPVQGAQSVAMNTTFNLEPVFQLGQLTPIDVLSIQPSVEATVTRAIIGSSIISGNFEEWVCDATHTVVIGIGDDCSPLLTSGGSGMTLSGAGISGATWTFTAEGIFTEEISFTGDSKTVGGAVAIPELHNANPEFRPHFGGVSVGGSGFSGGNLNSVTVTANIGREQLYALGQYKAVTNHASLPAEITYEIETIATGGDGVGVSIEELGCGGQVNTVPISVSSCGVTLSSKHAAFAGVSYGGGDTGGGNATITYTYTAYNDLQVG